MATGQDLFMKRRSLDENPLFWAKNSRKPKSVEGWYLLLRGRSLKQGQKKSCGVCCGQWGLSGMFDSLSHPLWHHNTSSTFTFHVFSFMVLSAGECGGYFWKPLKGKRSTLNPISVTTHALKPTMLNNDIRCISCKQYIKSWREHALVFYFRRVSRIACSIGSGYNQYCGTSLVIILPILTCWGCLHYLCDSSCRLDNSCGE